MAKDILEKESGHIVAAGFSPAICSFKI